ncbi:MAG: Do family serine endopeptidase, partial [Candidatus Acidiferrales bacterium]
MSTPSRWMPERKWAMTLGVVAALGVGILLGTLVSSGVRAAREGLGLTTAPLAVASPAEMATSFRDVAKKVEPAVVNISTEALPSPRRGRAPRAPQQPDPFQDFFDRFFGPPEEGTPQRSLGSGVIVDSAGYILTNYHVVENADKIKVKLHGGRKEYAAKLVGFDGETDVAVIKIEADHSLTAAPLGDSDAAEVGDWVLAIGSPFGLEATVTAGIISYKGREGFGQGQFQRFIQTDAAINRGNSGGPLVNLSGQVIGINTAIISSSGAYAGVGFALPSNIAVEAYNQIVKQGRVVRGSIGIRFRPTTSENPAVLRSLGAEHGVVVDEVVPGGPAAKAGLQRGDVVIQVDSTPVHTGDDLVNKVAHTPLGQQLKLAYMRDKKRQETSVTVEERTRVFPELAGGQEGEQPGEEANSPLGLTLEDLDPGTARQLGLEAGDVGVLVREVEPG